MKQIVTVLATVGLLAAGLPLHVCHCGCWQAAAVAKVAAASCPHCPKDRSQPTSDGQNPCSCKSCPDQLTFLPDSKTTLDSSHRTVQWLISACDAANVGALIRTSHDRPLAQHAHPPRATGPSIPILLGHLLL